MEIIEKNDSGTARNSGNSTKTGPLAVILLAAGAALLCWSLWILPPQPAWGFPWQFTLAVISFLPIAAGCWCLNALVLRRRDPSYRYGSDGHHGVGGVVEFALLFIVAGVTLLAFNYGVVPGEWRRVFFSWQMLFLIGAMSEYARGRFTWASVMLAVGGFFIIRRLAPLYPDIAANGAGDNWWPVLLIVTGVVILGGIFFKPGRDNCYHGNCEGKGKNWNAKRSHTSGVINIEVVFGSNEQVYLDPEFRGGTIATVFGGVKLDLRRTALPEGETYLKVESVFGGVEIDAPEEWTIEIRGESVFGGFIDKRLPAVNPGYTDGRKLIIKASSIFGGGEIK